MYVNYYTYIFTLNINFLYASFIWILVMFDCFEVSSSFLNWLLTNVDISAAYFIITIFVICIILYKLNPKWHTPIVSMLGGYSGVGLTFSKHWAIMCLNLGSHMCYLHKGGTGPLPCKAKNSNCLLIKWAVTAFWLCTTGLMWLIDF